jgi:hypothetical protein
VPPFKAFGEIAQDLIADAILGVSAHMGDNSQPARRFACALPKTFEIPDKIDGRAGPASQATPDFGKAGESIAR